MDSVKLLYEAKGYQAYQVGHSVRVIETLDPYPYIHPCLSRVGSDHIRKCCSTSCLNEALRDLSVTFGSLDEAKKWIRFRLDDPGESDRIRRFREANGIFCQRIKEWYSQQSDNKMWFFSLSKSNFTLAAVLPVINSYRARTGDWFTEFTVILELLSDQEFEEVIRLLKLDRPDYSDVLLPERVTAPLTRVVCCAGKERVITSGVSFCRDADANAYRPADPYGSSRTVFNVRHYQYYYDFRRGVWNTLEAYAWVENRTGNVCVHIGAWADWESAARENIQNLPCFRHFWEDPLHTKVPTYDVVVAEADEAGFEYDSCTVNQVIYWAEKVEKRTTEADEDEPVDTTLKDPSEVDKMYEPSMRKAVQLIRLVLERLGCAGKKIGLASKVSYEDAIAVVEGVVKELDVDDNYIHDTLRRIDSACISYVGCENGECPLDTAIDDYDGDCSDILCEWLGDEECEELGIDGNFAVALGDEDYYIDRTLAACLAGVERYFDVWCACSEHLNDIVWEYSYREAASRLSDELGEDLCDYLRKSMTAHNLLIGAGLNFDWQHVEDEDEGRFLSVASKIYAQEIQELRENL